MYTVEVMVKYGEIRILKKLFERLRGDTFEIKIIAYHYDYQLEEVENLNNNTGYEETNIQLGYIATPYVSTNYVGFH